MSKSRNNTTAGLSGKTDQFVYRQVSGRTIVAKPPKKSTKAPTERQVAVKMKFRKAAAWSKSVLTDPAVLLEYKLAGTKRGVNAYTSAMRDYLNPPSIDEIDTSKYLGQVGGIISIIAMDDFKVASVFVRIEKADGSLVEDGVATASGDGLHYLFTSSIAGNISGNKVIVTATDMPGNSIVKHKTI
jgi:hypothetical protein